MPFTERAARASVDGSDREIFNMDIKPSNAGLSKRSSRLHMLALCAVGLAINYLLAKVPLALNLPLYLDNVGSALAAALGGY